MWDGLQQADVWSSIGPVQRVWDPIVEDGVLNGFSWSTDIGGVVYEGTGTATEQRRPDRYQLVLEASEMGGTITVDLSPANPGGTHASVTVEVRSKGLLSGMFFPLVSRAVGGGLEQQVEELAAQLGR